MEVLPSHITISNRFKLIDNHCDHLARVELLPAKFYLADLFPSGAAWKQHMVTKRFKGLADLAEAQHEKHEEDERQQRDETVHESMVVLEEANKERAAQSLGKAREKLAERMENRKKRRTLKLAPSDAGAAPAPIQNARSPRQTRAHRPEGALAQGSGVPFARVANALDPERAYRHSSSHHH